MLKIQNLTKVYPNGTKALSEVSVEVPAGQFVAIIGLSGSGKSTLMRCINRLVEPTSGSVILDDTDITTANKPALRKARRKLGMVFQHFNLIKRASVLTNVLSGRLGYKTSLDSLLLRFSNDELSAAMANLERVGLTQQQRQRADTLSGGQQQRVGIARALMQNPQIILADEPVASLDPATAHTVLDYLESLNKNDGITVLCNLHFLSLARRYADRVIALKAGEIVFDGTPDKITNERFKEIYGEDAQEVDAQ